MKTPKQNIIFFQIDGDSGYLDLSNKSVNYFIIVQGGVYSSKKIIESLNKIECILLVFELNLSKINTITPFIIND